MGAWIETVKPFNACFNCSSHPIWVRGLKQQPPNPQQKYQMSHPIWVRGLKHPDASKLLHQLLVAPHMGAWIETSYEVFDKLEEKCRTPYGCVD